jgi:hypothetical protein
VTVVAVAGLLKKRRAAWKTVVRLADLDQAKSAALNRLSSADAQRAYRNGGYFAL